MTGKITPPIDIDDDDSIGDEQVERSVATIVRLALSDEACRLLGVDGTLEDEVDIDFASDPLAYVANEIATALTAESDDERDHLSGLVALVRLYQVTNDGFVDEAGLRDAVLDFMTDVEPDEDD
ncbi:MAG: hypothetical protein EBT47_10475 [Chloroflexi bacterium]|nr:hypothetical protein [Chloroflexota bacterium]